VEELTKAGIFVPGYKIKKRGFWLFPIIVPNKVLFAEYLNARGVCAYRGATQLRYVTPLKGYKDCPNSKWFMDNVIYLPLHSSVNDKDFNGIIKRTAESYKFLMKYLSNPNVPKPIHDLT
jgi:dTDP-4-amino-4,6-dideoxygalactose transaminase